MSGDDPTVPTGDRTAELAALERTLPARRGAGSSAEHPAAARPDDPQPPPPATAPVDARPGRGGLDRYQLLEEVGQGGMAIVYRARDLVLDREVAVKVLHAHLAGQAESRERLEREAHAVAKLRHENILEIFDYSGRDSDKSFIVTEFIHGTTLRVFMQANPISHPEIAELIVSEVARALEAAHKAGVIHRDVKPENVMIRNDGCIKLTDFGIAQIVDKERMTVTGQLLGSPAYMAPEHVEGGGIDFRTDVFAVGILLYQLATGQLPFRGKNPHEVLKRIAECVYTPPDLVNERVGRRLAQVIARALAKEKDARYADVGELRRELLADLSDAGLEDPRAELTQLFAAPPAYSVELGPRIVASLIARGRALKAGGRRAAALELWRRALEVSPTSGELLALIAGAERQRRVGRAAVVVVALAALAGGGAYAVRALRLAPGPEAPRAVAPPPQIAVPASTPGERPAPPAEGPAPGEETPRPRAHVDRPHALGPPVPAHAKRRFELVPTPKAVRVILDGQPLGDFGPSLQAIELDDKPHTIVFDSPFCYPETIPIGADTEPARISRRLKWKPATLTVTAEPEEADIVVDGVGLLRSGRPRQIPMPPMSDGRAVLRVKVSAAGHLSEEREVTLRANEAQTAPFTLRPTGAP